MHIPSADLAKTYFASDLSALIFAVNNPQTGTAVPGHVDRADIVDMIHGALAARLQILVVGILHMHQLHPSAFGVQGAEGIKFAPRESSHHCTPFVDPALKAELPERCWSRILRAGLYTSPMKPKRRRKQRKAYFSLSTSFSFALIRF